MKTDENDDNLIGRLIGALIKLFFQNENQFSLKFYEMCRFIFKYFLKFDRFLKVFRMTQSLRRLKSRVIFEILAHDFSTRHLLGSAETKAFSLTAC